MPRYKYECNACHEQFIVFHGITEKFSDCLRCDGKSLQKLVSTPQFASKTLPPTTMVGTVTEEFIDSSKEDLKKQKEDLVRKR